MSDSRKTKKQILDELHACRKRITELEKREFKTRIKHDKLQKKYHLFQAFIEELTEPVIVIDRNFKVHYANKAAYELSGCSNCTDTKFPSCHKLLFNTNEKCDQTNQPCLLKRVIKERKAMTMDHRIDQENGEKKIYEILGSPIWEIDGTLFGMIATIRDVTQHRTDQMMLEDGHDFLELRVQERTSELIDLNQALRQEIEERQKTELRLRSAKERAELLYQVSPCAIFTVNKDRHITSWNKKTEEVSGYSFDEIKHRKCDILCTSKKCGLFSEDIVKPIINHECTMRTKDGRELTISKSADLLHDRTGKVIGGIESFEDITERKQMDKMLRTERDKLQGIIAATGQGLHILNSNYEIEFQNDVLKKIFGDKIGHKCYAVYKQREAPCQNCRMHSVIENNQIEHADDIIFHDRHYSQSYAPFTDTDGQTKCLVLLRDITVEKANRAKTMRTAQLASIGELAAGVAHEINNPINGIINFAQILLDDEDQDEGRNALLTRLISEGERVADIVSKLLAFARQRDVDEDSFGKIDIKDVIDDSFSLFKHQFLKDGIRTTISVSPDIPLLQIHPHQLQQVFVNLFSNAGHALNERYPDPDPNKILEICAGFARSAGRDFIRITFTDHGKGIPEEIATLVFSPFFSTKQPGKGTGLGLSISQGLVQNFKGYMHIESHPGHYTRMIVDLPVEQKDLAEN